MAGGWGDLIDSSETAVASRIFPTAVLIITFWKPGFRIQIALMTSYCFQAEALAPALSRSTGRGGNFDGGRPAMLAKQFEFHFSRM